MRQWIRIIEGLDDRLLYRGFGGKGGQYTGQDWGHAVYLTGDLDLATMYGRTGGVQRAEVRPGLHVISADDPLVSEIAAAPRPSEAARQLGVDAIANTESHWVNRVSPREFILFSTDAVRFVPLQPAEHERYQKVKAMLGEGTLTESMDRTLYHGTLVKFVPEIMEIGLVPSLGDFTRNAYAEYEEAGIELPELVFAADREGVGRCYSAILGAMEQAGIEDTPENVFRYGAVVVLKDVESDFSHRESDEDEVHPDTVEPGDYYRDYGIKPDFALTGNRLRNFFRRNGVFIDRFSNVDRRTYQAELIRRVLRQHPDRTKDEVIAKVKALSDAALKSWLRKYADWDA